MVEHFKLPREDWYDEAEYDDDGKLVKAGGRIYKDRLIENLNAIEKILQDIANMKLVDSNIVDVSSIEFPDVTIFDLSEKIVNLRSFINIMNMKYFPLELRFKGNVCTKLSYYDNNYTYKNLDPVKLDVSDIKPYVYFNTDTETLYASDEYNTPDNCLFLAFWTDNRLVNIFSNDYADINVLYYLGHMSKGTVDAVFDKSTFIDGYDTKGVIVNNKWIGAAKTDIDTENPNFVVFFDEGRGV